MELRHSLQTLMKYTGLEDVDEALLKDTDCHRHQSHIHELGYISLLSQMKASVFNVSLVTDEGISLQRLSCHRH